MRDGVTLAADVYHPKADGNFPYHSHTDSLFFACATAILRKSPNSPIPNRFLTSMWTYRPRANVFLAGHRLRLEVSSSNFSRFDRNLNTGEDQSRATLMVKATNVIYHGREHSSAPLLPVGRERLA